MNLIDLMNRQTVFSQIKDALIERFYTDTISARILLSFQVNEASIRSTIRGIQTETLKINNIKVTSKDKLKYIITFNGNQDRFHCIWDFYAAEYISRSVNR